MVDCKKHGMVLICLANLFEKNHQVAIQANLEHDLIRDIGLTLKVIPLRTVVTSEGRELNPFYSRSATI